MISLKLHQLPLLNTTNKSNEKTIMNNNAPDLKKQVKSINITRIAIYIFVITIVGGLTLLNDMSHTQTFSVIAITTMFLFISYKTLSAFTKTKSIYKDEIKTIEDFEKSMLEDIHSLTPNNND
jgi:hypothetical protein